MSLRRLMKSLQNEADGKDRVIIRCVDGAVAMSRAEMNQLPATRIQFTGDYTKMGVPVFEVELEQAQTGSLKKSAQHQARRPSFGDGLLAAWKANSRSRGQEL